MTSYCRIVSLKISSDILSQLLNHLPKDRISKRTLFQWEETKFRWQRFRITSNCTNRKL